MNEKEKEREREGEGGGRRRVEWVEREDSDTAKKSARRAIEI